MGPAVQSRDPPRGTLTAGRGQPRPVGQWGRHAGRLQPALPALPSSGMAVSQLQFHMCLKFSDWTWVADPDLRVYCINPRGPLS